MIAIKMDGRDIVQRRTNEADLVQIDSEVTAIAGICENDKSCHMRVLLGGTTARNFFHDLWYADPERTSVTLTYDPDRAAMSMHHAHGCGMC